MNKQIERMKTNNVLQIKQLESSRMFLRKRWKQKSGGPPPNKIK